MSSSTKFVSELNCIKPRVTDVCVSFDIVSLYTNVPLHEVIEDVTEVLFHEDSNSILKTQTKFTKRVFKNMLKACSESIFLFNSEVYKQIDGLAMGSPLAPLLANWFVAKVENNLLQNPLIKQPIFYRRYVDDIFAVFHCEDDRDAFFSHLNNAHENLRFTMEKINTSTNSLPFLDVEISVDTPDKFTTKVYRKPTNTDVVLNYHAMAPNKWKTSLLKCLLSRARKLSSSQALFDKEVNNIKRIFKLNGYPSDFIDNNISNFLNCLNRAENETNIPVGESDPPEDIIKAYMVLPYVGRCSQKLHQRIKNEMQQHRICVLPAYQTTKVGSYFSLKTKVPPLLKNNVVYKFVCPCDKSTQYIGETERQLFQRVKDHTRTSNTAPSAVYDHMIQCEGCSQVENITSLFSIIRQCKPKDILSHEAICIRRFKPTLNTQMGPYKGCRVGISIFN